MTSFEIVIGIGILTNTALQAYDILWCRWHDCGSSSKNSHTPIKSTVVPSDDYPTQSVGSMPAELIKELK